MFHTSQLDTLINMARESSMGYLLFGLACCGIELMQTGGPRADLMRFGAIPRASPRQADFMIVAGTLTYKMAERAKLLYDQMSEPKYVISMGSCSNCGGLFQLAYSVCKGVDKVVPVDVYVPGCPPRPEAFFWGLLALQKMIRQGTTVREPGIRRKPVLAALPQGVALEDIREEIRRAVETDNVVNVHQAADEKRWAEKIRQWMAKHWYKP